MLRRFRLYGTGFAIGLVMVYFFFGRDDSRDLDIWTPSQRVLEAIRNDSAFIQSERLACYMHCLNINEKHLEALWKNSEVKSMNPGGDPYRYRIRLEDEDTRLEAEVERTGTQHRLLIIRNLSNPVDCDC